jgi:phage terminase large subunit
VTIKKSSADIELETASGKCDAVKLLRIQVWAEKLGISDRQFKRWLTMVVDAFGGPSDHCGLMTVAEVELFLERHAVLQARKRQERRKKWKQSKVSKL